MARDLVEVLFLALSGLAHADDRGRRLRRGRSRQAVGLERVAARPGDRHHLAARIAMLKVIARALAHPRGRRLMILVLAVEGKRRRLVVADGAQPVASGGPHMALIARGVTALVAG